MAMTLRKGWPKTNKEAEGRKVRTRRDMQNGRAKIPAGTIMTIDSLHGGELALSGSVCPCCGVTPRIIRVGQLDVQLLPPDWTPISEVADEALPRTWTRERRLSHG